MYQENKVDLILLDQPLLYPMLMNELLKMCPRYVVVINVTQEMKLEITVCSIGFNYLDVHSQLYELLGFVILDNMNFTSQVLAKAWLTN